MTSASVNQIFASQVRRTPDAIAVVGGDRTLTYAELNRCANRLAQRLIDNGVRPLDRVLLCLPRSVDSVIAMLAIARVGAAFVPVDPTYPDAVKQRYATDSGAQYVIAQPADADTFLPESPYFIETGNLPDDHDDDSPDVDAGHDDSTPIYVMFTSGSTGRPKGVIVAHRGVVRLVCDTNYIDVTHEDTILHLSPITFDASTFEIWGALLNGARLVVYEDTTFDPNAVNRLIVQERVTILWLTAALFHLVVRSYIRMLSGVRVLLAGGDVLKAAAVNQVFDAYPDITVINGYGPTENTTFTCCHVMTATARPGHTVPIGQPVSGTQVHILDGALQEVSAGTEGELCASGLGVSLGYLNAPEATRAAFVVYPPTGALLYRTGDVARRNADGVVEFLGRRDRLVKIRGYRVSLDELQTLIAGIADVDEAVVQIDETPTGDKRLIAIIQPAVTRPDMVAFVRRELGRRAPSFMIPDTIEVLEKIPLNTSGKVDQRRLRVNEI